MPAVPNEKTLYLVDGTSQLFRAYFAIRGLSNADGLPTNAIYGFTSMLRKLLQETMPSHIAVAFDVPGKVFRHDQLTSYKANRPPTPEDLDIQAPYAKQVCEVLGVPVLEMPGFEADDVIATYARLARRAGFRVVIVASDKDLLQLVGDGVTVLNPSKNVVLDEAGVAQAFGVPPQRVLDVLGLMGDSVDNIPGVPGVGEKTALGAVVTYGDLESVIRRAERFTEVCDARDALLAALDEPSGFDEALERFLGGLAELLEIEADVEMRERLLALRKVVEEPGTAGEPAMLAGRSGRPLQLMKRELKALDRGCSKRIWYAIRDHADQARLSRVLASLHLDVPVQLPPDALVKSPPDRARAHALFDSLGFRALMDEYAVEEAGSETGAVEQGSHETVLTFERLGEVVDECRRVGLVALGVQSDSADPQRGRLMGISLSHRTGRGLYVPVTELSVSVVREVLGPLLQDAAIRKVGQDLKFQSHVLRRHGMRVEGWELDTGVAAFLLNSSRTSYSLENLAGEFLGYRVAPPSRQPTGPRQLAFEGSADEPEPNAAAEGADLTLRLAGVLETRLREAGLSELYRTIDGPLLPLLGRMEAWGIRVDTARLALMSEQMHAALARARQEIHELAGMQFNVDSPKQLRDVLFGRLGLKPRRRTSRSGEASTAAETLEELAGEHLIARKILEYREMAKLKGTYVDSLPRLVNPDTARVHTNYHPTGAATGRLSSSDPNLQNIPVRTEMGRLIRAAFVPEPGFVFLASDYSQIELRVLAHLCGDEELAAAFRAGEDIHRHTAARVFGLETDQVTAALRQRAKVVNFGVLYGMSEGRLAREQGISRAEARRFIAAYFERFGGVRSYIDRVREQALRDGAVRTLFGRLRLFPQLRQNSARALQEQALRAAVNTTVQGTAADLMKLAMLRVESDLGRSSVEARMLLQVHDELLLEVREGDVEAVRGIVRHAMESVHPLRVPLVVDQKVGTSWLDVT